MLPFVCVHFACTKIHGYAHTSATRTAFPIARDLVSCLPLQHWPVFIYLNVIQAPTKTMTFCDCPESFEFSTKLTVSGRAVEKFRVGICFEKLLDSLSQLYPRLPVVCEIAPYDNIPFC